MKKLFLLIPALVLSLITNAAIPELTKTVPITLTAASEGFTQSDNAKALEDGEWINWSSGTINSGFAKWRINISDPGIYSVTLDMKCTNTYEFRVCVLNPTTNDSIVKVFTEHQDRGDYSNDALPMLQSLNIATLDPGEYDIIVTDVIQWSTGKIRGLTLSYINGARINLPATLAPSDALLSERAFVNGDNELRFTDDDNTGHILDEYGMWNIYTDGGFYSFTLNANSTNSHHYKLSVLNPDESLVQEFTLDGSSGTPLSATTDKINLAAGKYIIKIQNITLHSKGRVINIIANYMGGATVDIPATLIPDDAILSDRAWVDKTGTVDSILFTPRGSEGYNLDEWVKWKVNVTKAGMYNFTANTYRKSSQKFEISLLNSDESATLISNDNGGSSIGSGNASISTGEIELATGIYIVKVRNIYQYAESRLLSVVAEYKGGATIDIPATLTPDDVILSDEAWVDRTGVVDSILFTARGSEGHNSINWAKWKINVAKAGNYKFTANVSSSNGQYYKISVLNSNESATIGEKDGTSTSLGSGDKSFATDAIELSVGEYIVKIANTYAYSKGRVLNIIATYEGGAVVNAPGEIIAEEAVIFDNGNLKMFHNANGDLAYGNNDTPGGEYAYWNINATEAGEMAVSFNSPSGGHNFLFELYEGTTLHESVSEAGTDAIWEHNVTLADHLTIPAAGTYTLRVHNRTQWSTAILHSVTIEPYVAPAAVTIDENATDNSSWIDYKDGAPVNVQFIRTLTAGMYNTFCAPFAISSPLCKAVFGSDVEIYTLKEATVEGDILNVELKSETNIYQGTPVFIKPSADVVNPSFEGVSIVKETPAATTKTNANLVGTFIKTELEANPDILFLGPNNTLYFPEQTTPIKGMRAWFVVHDVPGGSHMIRHARIVQNEQVVTAIELVNQKPIDTIKVVENGQIIIVRDGIRYNTLGARVK